jgi:hypothetical protein
VIQVRIPTFRRPKLSDREREAFLEEVSEYLREIDESPDLGAEKEKCE